MVSRFLADGILHSEPDSTRWETIRGRAEPFTNYIILGFPGEIKTEGLSIYKKKRSQFDFTCVPRRVSQKLTLRFMQKV